MTKFRSAALSSMIVLAGLVGTSSAAYMASSSIGAVMTTPRGMTVYTFDEDKPSKSNCYGECEDSARGDVNGDNVGSVWHVVR